MLLIIRYLKPNLLTMLGNSQGVEPTQYIKIYPEDARLTFYPIFRKDIYEYLDAIQKTPWRPEEIHCDGDKFDYDNKLTPGQRRIVDYILCFFATADTLVNFNIMERFSRELPVLEVTYFYDAQKYQENIHAQTYALLLNTIITDPEKKQRLLDGYKTMPVIKRMADYIYKTISSDEPYPVRLLRVVCVEGIFFAGLFCLIYWLQTFGLMHGLCQSNEWIARDEGIHTNFGIYIFKLINSKYHPSTEQIHTIFAEAVTIAKEFSADAIPEGLEGMNSVLMGQYLESVADNLLSMIDIKPLYKSTSPFPFMLALSLTNKSNFFEKKVTEYSRGTATGVFDYSDNTEDI